jgi:GR25 family glycosyltransferase involved in LPS biosynthesis
MKVYQIVCTDNPISLEYMDISRESFKPLIDDGTLEFHTFDAITPQHPDFDDYVAKYDWRPSLALMDLGKPVEDHSPTEKAGMCSHWELMKLQGQSDERFLIMEHDTYLLEEHIDTFKNLLDYITRKNIHYANIGLFMGCYSMSKHCAGWMYSLLHDQKFWINGGPYGIMERLFKNYTEHYLRKRNIDFMDNTVVHPWNECDTLYFGKDVFQPYNRPNPRRFHPDTVPVPTTQCVSKRLKVTQDHHRYKDLWIEQPWVRHHYMKVLD